MRRQIKETRLFPRSISQTSSGYEKSGKFAIPINLPSKPGEYTLLVKSGFIKTNKIDNYIARAKVVVMKK